MQTNSNLHVYKQHKKFSSQGVENPIISVIVPAYNVEKYIEKCLYSLVKQTLRNIEIIVIDDGSTDKTSYIINLFVQVDKRISVISQSNSGPSAARNSGMEVAKGEYIFFLDADDYIDIDYLKTMYDAIEDNKCDIAVSDIIREHSKRNKYRLKFSDIKIYEQLKEKITVCDIPNCCYTCGKLYKKSLIENQAFKEGAFFEDILWLPDVIKNSGKLVVVPSVCYHYVVNKNSIVKKCTNRKKQDDLFFARKYIQRFFKENNLELPKKYKNITRRIIRFLNIPILKIKESEFVNTCYLFTFIPCFRYIDFDSHYIFKILGIRIYIRHKSTFNYSPATEYGLLADKRSPQLIVSLTSHPPRIPTVHIAINTLLKQTLKPDRIILWLAESQFPNKEKDLPEDLLKLKNLGLEIKWCEDLLSYKKIVPALKEFPEDIIITADDDIYYQEDWLESLYNAYCKNPKNVYVRRAANMKVVGQNIVSYGRDEQRNKNFSEPSFSNQLMGGSGCLFPPHCLYKDIFDVNNFLSTIPTHDDIYLWFMAILNGTKIAVVGGFEAEMILIDGTDKTALCKINNQKGSGILPEEAFKRMVKKYPQVLELIRLSK